MTAIHAKQDFHSAIETCCSCANDCDFDCRSPWTRCDFWTVTRNDENHCRCENERRSNDCPSDYVHCRHFYGL